RGGAGSGAKLSGPPKGATHVQLQVTADAATTPFDFCVTSITFAPTAPPPDAGTDTGKDAGPTGACTWTGGPSTGGGSGELTCYWLGQGTATGGGGPRFKTYFGYCGAEAGARRGGVCPTRLTRGGPHHRTAPHIPPLPPGTVA